MIKVTCVGTGSKGNCYIINLFNEKYLMIDCGAKNIKNFELKFPLNKLDLILISHLHQDHIEYLNYIYSIYRKQVFSSSNNLLKLHKPKPIIKDLTINLFSVPHDIENVGFEIIYKNKKIIYITDCGHIPEQWNDDSIFKNVDLLMIEANYDETYIKYSNCETMVVERSRSGLGHLSLQQTKNFINQIKPKNVLLLHYSKKNTTETIRQQFIEDTNWVWAYANGEYEF